MEKQNDEMGWCLPSKYSGSAQCSYSLVDNFNVRSPCSDATIQVMESPQDQPQQPSITTVSPTAPQTETMFSLVWVVIGIIVFLLVCGAVGAFYISSLRSSDQTNINQTNINPDLSETGWVSAEVLVNADLGYSLSNGDSSTIFFNGERTYESVNNFEVWVFDGEVKLPTYGISMFGDEQQLNFVSQEGIPSVSNPYFDYDSFIVYPELREDGSCGYTCRYYASDKNSRYFQITPYPPLPEEADFDTFAMIYTPDKVPTSFAKDRNYLYFANRERILNREFLKVNEIFSRLAIDSFSFEALGGGYYKDKNTVYYETQQYFSEVEGADANSIYYDFDSKVAKDIHNVYLYGRLIASADPETFAVLYPNEYYKDKNYVWETGLNLSTKILENADPHTFTYNRKSDVAKDRTHVWIDGRNGVIASLVPEVNPETFVALNFSYYKDSEHIYYGGGSDIKTTVSADKNSFKVYFPVFWEENDEERFVVGYAMDKNTVYYQGRPVIGADVTTFTPVPGPYSGDSRYFSDASDKNHKYKWGKIVE